MVAGEELTVGLERRVIAPVTTAAALGLVLSPIAVDGTGLAASTVVGLIWVSMLLGGLVAKLRGRAVAEGSVATRFLGLAATAALVHATPFGGRSLLELAFAPGRAPLVTALLLLALAGVGTLVERLLETLVAWRDQDVSWRVALAGEWGTVAGLNAATVSSGPLIALAYRVLDWVALPLFLLPIGVVLFAVRRVAQTRVAQREAVEAMSRLGEVAGVSGTGHTRRVADLSTRVAREMLLDEATVRRVERTALLHDIGLLGLDEPVVGGAGVLLAPDDRARVAAAEQRVLDDRDVFEDVTPLVEQVRTPFRHYRELGEAIPVESRVVRVTSALDTITEGATSRPAAAVALERLHLGLGYEYDPEVVGALEVLLRER